MGAWVTREWTERGKRRRAKAPPGTRGIKESDRFAVEWLDPSGKRCREKIKEPGRFGKNLADERCRQLNSQMTLGQYQHHERATWKTVKEKYLRDVVPTKRSVRTQREIKSTLARFEATVRPGRMDGITAATIDEFKAERLKEKTRDDVPIGSATVNKDLRTLKAFFRKVVKWKMMTEAPDIEMLEETEQQKPVYTEAEFEAIHKACGTAELTLPHGIAAPRSLWWQTLLVMFWETGMRRGEMLALEWSGVNLDRRTIIVDPADTKTKRLKEFSFGELGERHLRALGAYGMEGHVFCFPHEIARLNEALGEIQKAAGLDVSRRNLKFHAFRRTVGEMTAERYGLTAAQYKLGHSNAAVTAKHYSRAALRRQAAESTMPVPAGLRVVG